MNYNDYDDYDDYEVLYDFDESEVESDSYSKPLSIPDAFLACRRQLHEANIGYIAELAHTTKEEVALALQGTALFQNPEYFMRNAVEWNIDDGWEFREQYLSGFLPFKLRTAKIVNSADDDQKKLMAFDRAKRYKEEFANYKDGDNEGYYWQAVEIDAREYSEKAADEYRDKILSHLEQGK